MKTSVSIAEPEKQKFFTAFRREIALALIIKFSLLSGMWWLFFAGKKRPITESVMTHRLLGEIKTSVEFKNPEHK